MAMKLIDVYVFVEKVSYFLLKLAEVYYLFEQS